MLYRNVLLNSYEIKTKIRTRNIVSRVGISDLAETTKRDNRFQMEKYLACKPIGEGDLKCEWQWFKSEFQQFLTAIRK